MRISGTKVMALPIRYVLITAVGLAAASCSGEGEPVQVPTQASSPPVASSPNPATRVARFLPRERCLVKDRRVQPPALQIDAPAINLASPRQAAVVTESAEDAEGFVPGGSNDHPGFAPVGPFGPDRLLMRDNTREVAGSNDYFSWRPGGQPEFAWAVGEDLQEIVAEGTSSTKLATVQEGFVAPMAEWKLLLRDAEAGTACSFQRAIQPVTLAK